MSTILTTHLLSLKTICRCCHTEGDFKSLKEPYKCRGQVEVYYMMLKETFGILITPPTKEESFTICNDCIKRLRDSTKFRNQVETCEEKFNQYYQLWQKTEVQNEEIVIEIKKENSFVENLKDEMVDIDIKNEFNEFENFNAIVTNVKTSLNNVDEVQDFDVKVNGIENTITNEVQSLDNDITTVENNMEIALEHLKKEKTAINNENLPGCVFSQKKCNSKDLLKITIKENINKSYKCNDCKQLFNNLSNLKKHSRTVHNKPKQFNKDIKTDADKTRLKNVKLSNNIVCRFCNKKVQEHKYERHLKIHVGKTECINCCAIFDSTDLLKEHSKLHKYENMYTCDVCKKHFIVKSTLKRHIDIHHMGKCRKFMCHVCGVCFNDVTNLRTHTINVHQKLRLYECPVCQKKLASKKTLKIHMRMHTGERPYVCDECGEGFTCFTTLRKHRKKHDVMKKYGTKYVCEICETTFQGRGQLTHHLRSEHPGSLKKSFSKYKTNYFPCPSCNRVFSQKFSLDRHIKKHGAIVKVPCDICNKMFIDKFSLARHMRNVHTTKEKVKKEKVQCNMCKRKVHDIENHMNVHTVRPMTCDTCGKNYPDAAFLHRHIMNVHHGVNKVFQCTKCDRRPYTRKENLRSHMMKKHGCDMKTDEQ